MWEDQDKPAEIFADYGFAYYFMSYLQSLGFDQSFFTAWHHNTANGIEGLEATLGDAGSAGTPTRPPVHRRGALTTCRWVPVPGSRRSPSMDPSRSSRQTAPNGWSAV